MIDLGRNLMPDADGNLPLVDGLDELAQRQSLRLGTQQGEWKYNLDHGMPWLTQILGQAGDSAAIRQIIIDQIMLDSEIASVGEFSVQFTSDTRRLRYSIPVRTEEDETLVIV